MSKQTTLVFDVLAIIALLLFSVQAVFYALLAGPGYWGPTIGLLIHAGAIGTVLYILKDYGKTGRVLSILLLIFGWLYGLVAVVFGFAPGEFIEAGAALPKAIMLFYPILFLVSVLKKNIGDKIFKGAPVLYAGLSIGQIILLLTSGGGIELNGINIIMLMIIIIWLFAILYPLYRLFQVSGFTEN